jgi:hypothetical protein
MQLAFFAFLACQPTTTDPAAPEITSFTIDPVEMAAGDEVMIMVELANFALMDLGDGDEHGHDSVDEVSTDDVDVEQAMQMGHVHIYLDDLQTNPLAQEGQTMFNMVIPTDTTDGAHTVIARLHGSDHLIVEPQVTAEVDINVLASADDSDSDTD